MIKKPEKLRKTNKKKICYQSEAKVKDSFFVFLFFY